MGVPWLVAFALRADGWYLRSDIIWHKPNPMPESVTDRPTKAHEYLFLLAKSERYYYDADAIKEDSAQPERAGTLETSFSTSDPSSTLRCDTGRAVMRTLHRNRRTVWTVATQPYSGAHFATFPPALIEPCILAGSARQACETCGAPWERVVERTGAANEANEVVAHDGVPGLAKGSSHDRVRSLSGATYQHVRRGTDAFRPTCDCQTNTGAGRSVVLDPFGGAGTTGLVADRLGRNAILCEMNPDYAEMARRRITADSPLFGDVA
jgi:hypothetical protein